MSSSIDQAIEMVAQELRDDADIMADQIDGLIAKLQDRVLKGGPTYIDDYLQLGWMDWDIRIQRHMADALDARDWDPGLPWGKLVSHFELMRTLRRDDPSMRNEEQEVQAQHELILIDLVESHIRSRVTITEKGMDVLGN